MTATSTITFNLTEIGTAQPQLVAVFVVFVVIFVIVFVNVFVVVVVFHPSSLAFKFGQQSTVIFYSIYCMLNAVRVCYICYIVCCML